jgi:hypothetical protein
MGVRNQRSQDYRRTSHEGFSQLGRQEDLTITETRPQVRAKKVNNARVDDQALTVKAPESDALNLWRLPTLVHKRAKGQCRVA